MRLPTLDINSALRPAVERYIAAGRSSEVVAPDRRGVTVELGRIAALGAAVAGIAAVTNNSPPMRPALVVTLTVAYALAALVQFEVGAGLMVATQVVFVPMLLLLPPWIVPVAVAAGTLFSNVPALIQGRIHPLRVMLEPAHAWYAVGPALVIALFGAGYPTWDDLPLYVAAFGAQVVADFGASAVRERLIAGISPRLHLDVIARVYMVDALLTPIGLLAALAGAQHPYRSLLVLPLLGLLAIFAQERQANIQNALELSNAYRGTALLLGDVLEDKDAYTASHSHGVVSLSLAVADRMRVDPATRRRVEFGALLHDIGKIAVPAEIINKPGPLDDDEWAVMKLHTVEGQHMLDRVGGVLGEVGRVVRSSHEHFDGSGYPDGLQGSQIPIEARIVTCCDAFSAMTTTRSYRKAMSLESAREELVRNAGTQFDPDVVDALLEIIREERVTVPPPGVDEAVQAAAHSGT